MRRQTFFLQAVVFAIAIFLPSVSALAQHDGKPIGGKTIGGKSSTQDAETRHWIERLGHDSFLERERAKRELLERSGKFDATNLLKKATRHPLLEIREASTEILEQLALNEFDRQLDRLSRPGIDPESITLPFWDHYASIAGNDFAARNLFLQIARDRSELLIWMQHAKKRDRRQSRAESEKIAISQMSTLFDPYRMSATDAPLWALLFCCDCDAVDHGIPNLTLRVAMALSQSGLGPRTSLETHSLVLSRLIDHWLRNHPNVGTKRDRMTIAMRYDCHKLAKEISQQVLSDPLSVPSDLTIAMLCVATLDGHDLERILGARLNDQRTAHGWQLIATRRTKIRTQVRDVALAILLHHRGIDPRKVGFHELQADPLLVFREQSLGFPSEEKRQQAYVAAEAELSQISPGK